MKNPYGQPSSTISKWANANKQSLNKENRTSNSSSAQNPAISAQGRGAGQGGSLQGNTQAQWKTPSQATTFAQKKQTQQAKVKEQKEASDKKKPAELKLDLNTAAKKPTKVNDDVISVSQERLQDSVIWAEILGKPLSKRRQRRIV